MPDGLWTRCNHCNSIVYRKEVEEGLNVCPKCNFHFSISAWDRIEITVDENSFEEYDAALSPADPLEFVDREAYPARLKRYQEKTGLRDAIISGRGTIEGIPVLLGVTDFHFMAGSMGSVIGEKICRLTEEGIRTGLPLILISASGGGARMQEGIISLMQMAKTGAAVARYRRAGGLYISVLTNPTMAGVMASFAALGDIVLAEPMALIGFTGSRVIEETIKEKMPPEFQRSEFALKHGLIDKIVPRKEMKATLAQLIRYCIAEGAESESG